MDVGIALIAMLVVFILEPGNEKINAYCTYAIETNEFESRKLCWDYYHEYREDIPDIPELD
jgi:hypothetical protein|tara:strand:+ start:1143 stop:1325 length:183 start_codon:yes stop_codon:yes gene_type:complete